MFPSSFHALSHTKPYINLRHVPGLPLHPFHQVTMSTIASPRPSSSIRSPSSTRTSLEASGRPPSTTRRNRAALRDYYGLKAAKDNEAKISEESTRTELGPEEDETLTELDATNFDADAYVNSLLAKEGLKGVLRVEADLVSRTYGCSPVLCTPY